MASSWGIKQRLADIKECLVAFQEMENTNYIFDNSGHFDEVLEHDMDIVYFPVIGWGWVVDSDEG